MERFEAGDSVNMSLNHALAHPFNTPFPIIPEILKYHPLSNVLSNVGCIPEQYLFDLWESIKFVEATSDNPEQFIYSLESETHTYHCPFDLNDFRVVIGFPKADSRPNTTEFVEPPDTNTMLAAIHALGYEGSLNSLAEFKKKNVAKLWYTLYAIVNQCLSPSQSGSSEMTKTALIYFYGIAYDMHFDYAKVTWDQMKAIVKSKLKPKRNYVPFMRFFSLMIENALQTTPSIPKLEKHFSARIRTLKFVRHAGGSVSVATRDIPQALLNYLPQNNRILGEWLAASRGPANPQVPAQGAHRTTGEGPSRKKRKGGDEGEGSLKQFKKIRFKAPKSKLFIELVYQAALENEQEQPSTPKTPEDAQIPDQSFSTPPTHDSTIPAFSTPQAPQLDSPISHNLPQNSPQPQSTTPTTPKTTSLPTGSSSSHASSPIISRGRKKRMAHRQHKHKTDDPLRVKKSKKHKKHRKSQTQETRENLSHLPTFFISRESSSLLDTILKARLGDVAGTSIEMLDWIHSRGLLGNPAIVSTMPAFSASPMTPSPYTVSLDSVVVSTTPMSKSIPSQPLNKEPLTDYPELEGDEIQQLKEFKEKAVDDSPPKRKQLFFIPKSQKPLHLAPPSFSTQTQRTTTPRTTISASTPAVIPVPKPTSTPPQKTPTPPPNSQTQTTTPSFDMSLDEMFDFFLETLLSNELSLDFHDKAVLIALQSRKTYKEQEEQLRELKAKAEEEKLLAQQKLEVVQNREDLDSQNPPKGENIGEGQVISQTVGNTNEEEAGEEGEGENSGSGENDDMNVDTEGDIDTKIDEAESDEKVISGDS